MVLKIYYCFTDRILALDGLDFRLLSFNGLLSSGPRFDLMLAVEGTAPAFIELLSSGPRFDLMLAVEGTAPAFIELLSSGPRFDLMLVVDGTTPSLMSGLEGLSKRLDLTLVVEGEPTIAMGEVGDFPP